MDRIPTGMGQRWKFSTAEGLFGIGVGCVLAFADLFCGLDESVAFCVREARVANINIEFLRNADPVLD